MAITNKDTEKLIGKFAQVFVTKEEAKNFATKDDLSSLRDEMLTGFDKVLFKLEKMEEDRIFTKAKDDEQDERLDAIEKRVVKLEIKI